LLDLLPLQGLLEILDRIVELGALCARVTVRARTIRSKPRCVGIRDKQGDRAWWKSHPTAWLGE
jgi:hypothetical protein